jgi:hypothetical protein
MLEKGRGNARSYLMENPLWKRGKYRCDGKTRKKT